MSDLVRKVAKAIQYAPQGDYLMDWEPEARAAILAVAEWLAQSEDRECNPLQCLHAQLREPK